MLTQNILYLFQLQILNIGGVHLDKTRMTLQRVNMLI